MSEAEEVKLEIKVVMNKEKTKFLFAEAGSDFVDVLLSFLLLPLGMIVNILEKHYGDEAPAIGSLNSLYNSVENLENIHFCGQYSHENILIPESFFKNAFHNLRVDVTQLTSPYTGKTYDGVFTKGASSFIIKDDLQVMPNGAGSIMEILSKLGISVSDMDGAETMSVTFGLNEIIALLRASIVSRNPFSALLLHRNAAATVISEPGNMLLRQIVQRNASMKTKKMILEVIMQKSTNMLLFAKADHDFINFLFSVLTVPLGKVGRFLGLKTGLKNMDNLQRSIADMSMNMHLHSSTIKSLLINYTMSSGYYSNLSSDCNEFSSLTFDPSKKIYGVKEAGKYVVRDDLSVAPLSITSFLSLVNGLGISLSDVEELKIEVGLEEGLSIVKAALISTTALTDGLMGPVLMKKQGDQGMDMETEVEEDGLVNRTSKRPRQGF